MNGSKLDDGLIDRVISAGHEPGGLNALDALCSLVTGVKTSIEDTGSVTLLRRFGLIIETDGPTTIKNVLGEAEGAVALTVMECLHYERGDIVLRRPKQANKNPSPN